MGGRACVAAVMATAALGLAGSRCAAPQGGEPGPEVCPNGRDDDGDGLTDCADPDCAGAPLCPAGCGDGVCGAGETAASCPADCTGGPRCGDRRCDPGETTASCPADCGGAVVCGDGRCDPSEEPLRCPDDCAGSTGALPCLMLDYCVWCCPLADEPCEAACLGQGTREAQHEISAMYTCAWDHCDVPCGDTGSYDACGGCLSMYCIPEFEACDVYTVGSAGCARLMACLKECPAFIDERGGSAATCPADPGMLCTSDCYRASHRPAVDLLWAYWDCVWMNCETQCDEPEPGAPCDECIASHCSAEGDACLADA